MQPNEALKPKGVEMGIKPPLPHIPKQEGEKGAWADRLKTHVGDFARDIVTANKMATDKFDGDTALLRAAKGSVTALIGVGLERVINDVWEGGMSGKELLSRPYIKFSQKTIDSIRALEKSNPRLHLFATQAIKDVVTGITYNGLAFFSRPMLESLKAEHLIASLGINVGEAIGLTHGVESPAKKAAALDRKQYLETNLESNRRLMTELVENKLPKGTVTTPASEAFEQLGVAKQELSEWTLPEDTRLAWQMAIRKYLKYSNPASLFGISMIADGGATLVKNFLAVRKTRREKGGLPGQKVFMPKNDDWHKGGGYRKDDRRQEKRPYNKDKVYYGRGKATAAAEEEALEKLI